jgi:hypothetical protein
MIQDSVVHEDALWDANEAALEELPQVLVNTINCTARPWRSFGGS